MIRSDLYVPSNRQEGVLHTYDSPDCIGVHSDMYTWAIPAQAEGGGEDVGTGNGGKDRVHRPGIQRQDRGIRRGKQPAFPYNQL